MNVRLRSGLTVLLLQPLLGCHESSDSPRFLAPGLNSLGIASEGLELSDGILAAREFEAGDDQNGDGDGDDTLLRIVDLASGFTHLVPDVGAHRSGGRIVAFTVPEAKAGADLNGDGDQLDQVLHVYDARRRRETNVGFATDGTAPLVSADFVVAVVFEEEQGRDLDGDTRLTSVLPVVYDPARALTAVLGIEVGYQGESLEARGNHLVGFAREDQRFDLNGDGDRDDELAFWHDLRTDTTQLGYAADGSLACDGHLLAYLASEGEESEDIDGDGTSGEQLCVLVELDSNATHVLGEEGEFEVGGGLAFLRLASEIRVFDALTGVFDVLQRFPLEGEPKLADRRAAFLVEETFFGDANGDGDETDDVLFVYDARTGLETDTGLAVAADGDRGFELDGERVAFLYSESCDGGGSCPGNDLVLRLRRHADGVLQEIPGLSSDFVLGSGWLARIARGFEADDSFLVVHDLATGSEQTLLKTEPYLLQATEGQAQFALEGQRVVFTVREDLFEIDGNGDGDTSDAIVNAWRLR